MMQQYLRIKEDHQDSIVFFRLGDFYEMFFDDALLASKVLDIALTSRDAGQKVPMCGVPHHAAAYYIQKLVEQQYKIAIAEQVSEPGKGLVEREVTRIITPGTVLEEVILSPTEHHYMAGLSWQEEGYGLVYIDLSTGEGYYSLLAKVDDVLDVVTKYQIKELVTDLSMASSMIKSLQNVTYVTPFQLVSPIQSHSFNHLNGVLIKAAQLCFLYVQTTLKHPLSHIQPLKEVNQNATMQVSQATLKHLDVLDGNNKHTLFHTLNKTHTPMGARLLKRFLMMPLVEKEAIIKRHDMVDALLDVSPRKRLTELLKEVYDTYRLTQRIAFLKGSPRDLEALKLTLAVIPSLKQMLLSMSEPMKAFAKNMNEFTELHDTLARAIIETPPISVSEGGFIKEGYDAHLDEWIHLLNDHEKWLENYLNEQKELTQIKNLKIGYHRVFGYYLEVTKGQDKHVIESFEWIRLQTLANSERYTTDVLKSHEAKVAQASSQKITLEQTIFNSLVNLVLTHLNELITLSEQLAHIDVYLSMAIVAQQLNYVKPTFNEQSTSHILKGRHPVIERLTRFIHNDVSLKQGQMLLITGPNMSGKSTYMRMIALISLMAQVGFYVPAQQANLCLYDGIYTRIGASDDLSSGQSTFMMEMTETNDALRHATSKSLLIFDEIGRGTSTYDGMALAHGILEYIHEVIGCHTLFSTHYHELTSLEHVLPRLNNIHVKAKLQKGSMIFLHQIEPGKSDRSYGIQVAALAQLPEAIIKRSAIILKDYESKQSTLHTDLFNFSDTRNESDQVEITSPILEALKQLDIHHVTPMEALRLIDGWKKSLDHGDDDV
jgi:DNA mismatch repair protein MutS